MARWTVSLVQSLAKWRQKPRLSQHAASSSAWGFTRWALICQANEPGVSEFWFTPCNYSPGFAFANTSPPPRSPTIGCCQVAAVAAVRCRNTKAKQIQAKQVRKPAMKWEGARNTPFAALSMWFNCAHGQSPIILVYSGSPNQTNTNWFLPLWCFIGSPTNK